jgi:hypothetical protein
MNLDPKSTILQFNLINGKIYIRALVVGVWGFVSGKSIPPTHIPVRKERQTTSDYDD